MQQYARVSLALSPRMRLARLIRLTPRALAVQSDGLMALLRGISNILLDTRLSHLRNIQAAFFALYNVRRSHHHHRRGS